MSVGDSQPAIPYSHFDITENAISKPRVFLLSPHMAPPVVRNKIPRETRLVWRQNSIQRDHATTAFELPGQRVTRSLGVVRGMVERAP